MSQFGFNPVGAKEHFHTVSFKLPLNSSIDETVKATFLKHAFFASITQIFTHSSIKMNLTELTRDSSVF